MSYLWKRNSHRNKPEKGERIPWWNRLRIRVLAVGIVLSMLPVTAVSSYYIAAARNDLQKSIQIQNNLLVQRTVAEVRDLLNDTVSGLNAIPATDFSLQSESNLSVRIYAFLKSFPMADEVVVLNSSGNIVQGVNRFKIFVPASSSWHNSQLTAAMLSRLRAGYDYYSPVTSTPTGIPTVKIAVPLFSLQDRQFLGAVGAQISLRSLFSPVHFDIANQKAYAFVVDQNGVLIAHTDFTRVLEKTDVSKSLSVQQYLHNGDPAKLPSPNEYTTYTGQKVLGVYGLIPETHWAVVIEQPVSVAFAPVNELIIRLFYFLLIIMGATVLLSILFGLHLTRPIEYLEKVVRNLGIDSLPRQIALRRQDELGHLAQSFNSMVAKLRIQSENLLQEKERLDAIVNGFGAGFALVYPDFRIAWINPILAKWVKGELITTEEDLLNFLTRQGQRQVFRHQLHHLQHVQPCEPSRLVVVEDITEQRHLEEIVIQADKLSALGLMASGFAHEINNPLATIQAYTEDLQETLSSDGSRASDPDLLKRYLDVILRNVARAKHITQSLLNFSRRSEWKQEWIDVIAVTEESLLLIEHALIKKHIRLVRNWQADLPRVKGDRLQLMQVLVNLLNNALAAVNDEGEIILEARVDEDHLSLSVQDNGEGIEAHNLTKVFDPFFTTKEVGAGTGLGLSVSYGIISRLGGTITIHSEIGRGTRVIVNLPLPESPSS